MIIRLKDDQGTYFESHGDISNLLVNHFTHIVKEPAINRDEAIREVVSFITKLLTEEHNRNLDRPISKAELEEAVQEFPNGKSPCPNGFTIDFFKACWDTIKNAIW